MLKPIIIIDGFDPTDTRKFEDCDCENNGDCANEYLKNGVYDSAEHRSLVDLMGYKDQNNDSQNFINKLRDNGYDVIIVNQPTYYRNGIKIDGGADFIERNALNLASFIRKLNLSLLANNSSNQIVVVGPSMGGQISRFALAWMEKKFAETGDAKYKHNTRLWVAFDSPNLGSNVPLGDQALVNLLSEESEDAKKKYNEFLGSTASKQLLIEYHQQTPNEVSTVVASNQNGQTTTMGSVANEGNPYFQSHFNSQFTNGLPNSKGYPMNLRKIAIVNGSLTGATTGTDSEKILDIHAIQRFVYKPFGALGWNVSIVTTARLAEFESFNMPAPGATAKIAYFDKIFRSPKQTSATNSNGRGNMDIVPGGLYGASEDISSGVTSTSVFSPGTDGFQIGKNIGFLISQILGGADYSLRALKPYHSFIPTFSALGMKNPNQNWASPLNRNLVCSNETPFDSYYGEALNTEHISLSYKGVEWLLKELGDSTNPPSPKAPTFPTQENLLSGPGFICGNTTFTFADVCKLPSAVSTWTVYPNTALLSSTPYSVTISGSAGSMVNIKATFQNGQTISKEIWSGKPSLPQLITYSNIPYDSSLQNGPPSNPVWFLKSTLAIDGVNEYVFKDEMGTIILSKYLSNGQLQVSASELGMGYGSTSTFYVYPKNSCGEITTIKKALLRFTLYYPTSCQYGIGPGCYVQRISNTVSDNSFYKIYPNPSSNIVNVNLKNEELKPSQNATIIAELYNMMGEQKRNITILNNIASIDVSGLPIGIYILKITIDGTTESHQIRVE